MFDKLSRRARFLGVLALASGFLLFVVSSARFYSACNVQAASALAGPMLPAGGEADEAIVVLAGDRGRIPAALNLLRLRNSANLLISGAGKTTTLVDLMNLQGEAATRVRESWNRILFESQSSSTWENAIEAKALLVPPPKRIILVTSDYHMVRAAKIFHRVLPGVTIVRFPVTSQFSSHPGFFSEEHLKGLWYFMMEYLKLIQLEVIPRMRAGK